MAILYTLTPGIFTIYCIHGVCYGFEMMRRCESPRVPFSIFTSQFDTPPRSIMYDNACKLHVYCLNREPALYKQTRFFVDRFHWRGHVGCSRGYSLDSYQTMDIRSINSKVNEQANAGLQRIKAQLAYMKPDNFKYGIHKYTRYGIYMTQPKKAVTEKPKMVVYILSFIALQLVPEMVLYAHI